MINEIKKIIVNYLNSVKMTQLMIGSVETVNPLSIKIGDKLIIPYELITGNQKANLIHSEQIGSRLRLICNYGGQEYFILEVINDVT
ncbi:DUF2577 family protein [Cellulosilyticum sp. I15G10I2]|uniref:DUF2577 family protein n=1 Tax=Cellulosilyticum sp. I15G10I2 TaxID=1892843 RepID=UPI00085CAFEA|nr:DUF2577 family protein [Cellulosilyticum sp. I15G10I2]